MRWTPLHNGLTLIPWALGTAVAVPLIDGSWPLVTRLTLPAGIRPG